MLVLLAGLNPESASASYYAQTSWPAIHHDSRNSDSILFSGPESLEIDWEILDGTLVWAEVTIGPRDGLGVNLYVTSGLSGLNHLQAYRRDGVLRWETDRLDIGAALSSPTVDVDGDLYIADLDQLFAFHSDGEYKWSVDSDLIFSSAISADGYLVTATKYGVVNVYRRNNGSLAAPRLYLPVGSASPGPPAPDGLWEGMMDPEMIQLMYDVISGSTYPMTNTPAVNPNSESNRIYVVTGTSETPGEGRLFGIDFDAASHSLDIAFEKPMGPYSQTSPAISPVPPYFPGGFVHIYVADRNDYLYAFDDDENNSNSVWQYPLPGGNCPGSPSVGRAEDGIVPIYFLSGGMVVALEDHGGYYIERWVENFADLAAYYGYDAAKADSIVSVARNYLYVSVGIGNFSGDEFIPELHVVCILDPYTGGIVRDVEVRDACLGGLTMDINGRIYVTHAGDIGGITALKPVSSLALAQSRIQSGKISGEEALSVMKAETLDNAAFSLSDALNQLQVVYAPLEDAVERGEITQATADSVLQRVNEAITLFDNVKKIIEDSQGITAENIENAKKELSEGIAKLNEALALP